MRSVTTNAAIAALAVVVVIVLVAVLGALRGPAPGPVAIETATPAVRPTDPPRPSDQPCPVTLQAAIDTAPPGSTLDLRGCSYASGATVDRPLTLLGGTLAVPAGEVGITVDADDVTLDGVRITGAQADRFVLDEVGVRVMASPEDPVRRLVIRGCEIATFGGFGTYLRNVADVRIEGNDVHDVVYAGLMVLSGSGGTIEGNTVRRIGVRGSEANDGNAYGIALTTLGDEPRTADFAVAGNTVEDVPTWHAIDTHGGVRIAFTGNTVRRSMRGIFVTMDGAGNEPTSITIADNRLLSPAPVDTNLAAVTLYRARSAAILDNLVTGWGEGNFLRDFEDQSTHVVVEGNTVQP